MSALLYAAKLGHFFLVTKKSMEAFQHEMPMTIIHMHWAQSQRIANSEVTARTGLLLIVDFIRRRRVRIEFTYIARLITEVQSHSHAAL